jgi:hypothetical protein
MRNGAWIVAALLSLTAGCPIPIDYQKEPKPPNYPPVVDSTRTTPSYLSEVVVTNSRPMWNLWVSDANLEDTLRVKVIKDMHLALPPESTLPLQTLLETTVFPTDVPPAEMELPPELRTKLLELAYTPCPDGAEGTQPLLTVCICDQPFQLTDTQKNPCLPTQDGYVTSYTVLVHCVAEP